MPGLAVAEALRDRGWSVSWLGTRMGMERQLIEPRGIAFDAIDFSGLRGKGVKTLLLGGFYLLRALWQSRALIRARKPRVMFSTGGYVAVPAGMAASTLGVPLVLLNSDAAPLMSTKMLKPLSSAVLCGFDGAAAKMAGDNRRRDRQSGARRNSADRSTRAALRGPFRSVATAGYRRQPGCSGCLTKTYRAHWRWSHPICAQRWFINAAPNTSILSARFIERSVSTPKSSRSSMTCQRGTRRQTSSSVAQVRSRFRSLLQPEWQACWFRLLRRPLHTSEITRNTWPRMAPRFTCRNQSSASRLADLLRSLTRDRLLAMAMAARSIGKPDATQTVASVIEKVAA